MRIQANGRTYYIDRHVDVCPCCHHAVSPKVVATTTNKEESATADIIDIVYKCPRHKCSRLFIGVIVMDVFSGNYLLKRSFPSNPKAPTLPDEVKEISPSFVKVFGQASAADKLGLDAIAGGGYRKALEFLIKDYCIHIDGSKEEIIKSLFLGAVIDKHVDDKNIKVCASRAAWLGNDETHYERKWKNKDIEDLKRLIELTVIWVKSNILTEKYKTEMS